MGLSTLAAQRPRDCRNGKDGWYARAGRLRRRPARIPRSKFGCPAVPVRAIARPRLGEVLAQPDWRVALVTGGPATGKTVAVAQWFETLDPVAREWVTLDAGDDRPERFWLTFVLALERAVPGAFAQAAASAADVHPSAAGVSRTGC